MATTQPMLGCRVTRTASAVMSVSVQSVSMFYKNCFIIALFTSNLLPPFFLPPLLFLCFPSGWRLFDDSTVTMVEESQVVTRYAYVLFYRRRNSPVERPPRFVRPVGPDLQTAAGATASQVRAENTFSHGNVTANIRFEKRLLCPLQASSDLFMAETDYLLAMTNVSNRIYPVKIKSLVSNYTATKEPFLKVNIQVHL